MDLYKISWHVKVFVSWQRHDFHLSCLSLPKHVFFWTTVFLTIFFQVILFVFDATDCFRCFTFKMFSIGRRCFWLIFFQVILSLFDVSCGTDPRIIRHRIHGRYKSVFLCILQISKFQRRAVSSEIIKLDRVLTLNSSSLKQNLVISVCFNYAQVLPKFCTFR